MGPQSRTTSEDALYSAASLKPKTNERWLLGCFRVVGFQVEPYPVEFVSYRLLSLDAIRQSREGVDRPHRLSADG